MPNSNSHTPKGWATGAAGFTSWVNVKVYQSGWQNAKKVFRCISPGVWTEVWSNRPVVTTAAGTSSAYDRITANGAVNPNNFSATPRFYYKKNADSAYTAGTELTALTGATSQDVASTITGLAENTTYNYYLSATNSAGTSDVPTVQNVTTPIDCRTVAAGAGGWLGTAAAGVTVDCGTCGRQTTVTTTYTKTGCTTYSAITSDTGCVERACECKTASTNGWSAAQYRYRDTACGSNCGLQVERQTYITKTGCTEHVTTDWTLYEACVNERGYDDKSDEQVEGGYWAGIRLRVGTYGFMGPTAIFTYTNVQCGLGGTCCGGNAIKYYAAEQCSYVPDAKRWTLLGCYSFY